MNVLKFLVWSVVCMGVGIFGATYEIDGKTPLEHALRTWRQTVNPGKVERLKDSVADTLGGAKDKLASAKEKLSEAKSAASEKVASATERKPREHISDSDREELDKLISKRSASK